MTVVASIAGSANKRLHHGGKAHTWEVKTDGRALIDATFGDPALQLRRIGYPFDTRLAESLKDWVLWATSWNIFGV
jgi:hypothetical protein